VAGAFDQRFGRPSIPVDTLLRLLYLKYRFGLGYESLCRDVADSIGWRRFCRIGLEGQAQHPTTLVKLVRRAGPEVIAQLNQALSAKLAADKLLRSRKLSSDGVRRTPARRSRTWGVSGRVTFISWLATGSPRVSGAVGAAMPSRSSRSAGRTILRAAQGPRGGRGRSDLTARSGSGGGLITAPPQ
jgi:IS5 family transposase